MDNSKLCGICGTPIKRHYSLNRLCSEACFNETSVRLNIATNKDRPIPKEVISLKEFEMIKEKMEMEGTWGCLTPINWELAKWDTRKDS